MSNQRTLYVSLLEKHADESLNCAIILSRWLDQNGTDLLINTVGTPEIFVGFDSELTISDQAKNGAAYTSRRKGTTHPAGEVITYTVSGGTSGKRYEVQFPFTTTDGQTLVVIQPFYVI